MITLEQKRKNQEIIEKHLIEAFRRKSVKIDFKNSQVTKTGKVKIIATLKDGTLLKGEILFSYYRELEKKAGINKMKI